MNVNEENDESGDAVAVARHLSLHEPVCRDTAAATMQ